MALPTEVQYEIIGHLSATSEQPMDDLHNLQATCSSMLCICGDPTVGRCMTLDWCRHGARSSNNRINYFTLLARLTQVGNPETCFLTGIQTVLVENHCPGHASTTSPTSPMAGTIWWPIWSPYSSIGTMAMPATMTL
jgi:hypothetical protein